MRRRAHCTGSVRGGQVQTTRSHTFIKLMTNTSHTYWESSHPYWENSHPYWENMFCRLTSQRRTVHEMCLGNTKNGNGEKSNLKNAVSWTDKLEAANWQTGGGAKSALVPSRNQLHKFWQAYPRLTLPLIPTMYDTWGGTSRILGARGLRKKLSPVEGFRPPTHYVVWVGEPD